MSDLTTLEQLLQELHLKGKEKALGPVLAKAEKSGLSGQEVIYTLLLEEKSIVRSADI